ncbi:hypothetical protein BsWGS_18800 [Bradybaena similaris]
MTLENLQHMYMNSQPGYQVCYFDGSFCTRGQEYCSAVHKTCEPLFSKDASEDTKLNKCLDIIQKNETEPGIYDSCIYLLGVRESRKVIADQNESHAHEPHTMRPMGMELCPFPEKYCRLGYEFCNTSSGNCEPLFPAGVKDAEKRQRCESVIQANVTMLYDACIYALGILGCSSSNITDQNAVLEGNTSNEWGIAVTVVLAIVVAVAIGAGVAVFIIRRKKMYCFKETQASPKSPNAKPRQRGDDIRKGDPKALQELIDADGNEGERQADHDIPQISVTENPIKDGGDRSPDLKYE